MSTRARVTDALQLKTITLELMRFIRAQGASARGPLIQVARSGDDGPGGSGAIELVQQADRPVSVEGTRYRFDRRIELPRCAMAHFQGHVSDMHLAYSKLAVHAYEQEVSLSGIFYAVILGEEGTEITSDVFALTDSDA